MTHACAHQHQGRVFAHVCALHTRSHLAHVPRRAAHITLARIQKQCRVIDTILDILIRAPRSEEHTSELQSLMRISYAVFCLKKKTNVTQHDTYNQEKRTQIT